MLPDRQVHTPRDWSYGTFLKISLSTRSSLYLHSTMLRSPLILNVVSWVDAPISRF